MLHWFVMDYYELDLLKRVIREYEICDVDEFKFFQPRPRRGGTEIIVIFSDKDLCNQVEMMFYMFKDEIMQKSAANDPVRVLR